MANERQTYPPANERACVKLGLATIDGGQIRYDWDSINVLWAQDPELSQKEFAKRYHLPYEYFKEKCTTSSAAKEGAFFQRAQVHRVALIEQLAIRRASNLQQDAARISETVAAIEELASAGVKYARARLFKQKDGVFVVNPAISPTEVLRCMSIGEKGASMLRAVLDIYKVGLGDDKTKSTTPVIEPIGKKSPRT